MPYIPHSPEQVKQMCEAIGISEVSELFDEIPPALLVKTLEGIPAALNEHEMRTVMYGRASLDANWECYLGGGAYEHHIPAPVWRIASRGEFLTSYTPYQAECSQGTLQLLYEFQTMMASLMGLDVSNASLYDGATSITEAILMCVRHLRKRQKHTVWVPQTLSLNTKEVLNTLLDLPEVTLAEVPHLNGRITTDTLNDLLQQSDEPPSALVIAQPNYLGAVELVDELVQWAHQHDIMVIAYVNPLSMALLKPPGQWGGVGADIACGEAQPFGIPLSSGGPYLGFLCAKTALIRQMPGRIVGQTKDAKGNTGYCLTLQAREQHIRRAKATSNVCTNQGLLVVAATLYLALMGQKGLKSVAERCHLNAKKLKALLHEKGLECYFNQGYFHELVLRLPVERGLFLKRMQTKRILAGLPIEHIKGFEDAVLVCVTETKSESQLEQFATAVMEAIEAEKTGEPMPC